MVADTSTSSQFEKEGDQRVAIVALFTDGDHVWIVSWRGYTEHEIADRTMLLQMLSTWRFTDA